MNKREREIEQAQQVTDLLDTVARIEGKLELLLDHVGIEEIKLTHEEVFEGEVSTEK
jgi:hypothetical protein